MTHQEFQEWLSRYKAAWETRNPQAAANIFSLDAKYYETPFSTPFTGREQILNYWADVPRHQDKILFSFQILAVDDQSGIVQWQAEFERLPSHQQVFLDGILQATFDENRLCVEFKEWWHRLEGEQARQAIKKRGE